MDFDLDKIYCGVIRRGDVFLYEDKNGQLKPVVVLQDDILNNGLPTVVCALIKLYTKAEEIFINEIFLDKKESGLGKDGICLLHKIFTLERSSLVAKKAEVKQETLKKIYLALDLNLGRFRD